jgi:hypothetical protein
MIDLVDIPIWVLALLNAVVAVGLWLLCVTMTKSRKAMIPAACALVVAYAGISIRAAASAGSARVTLIIAAEAIVALVLCVLPFVAYLKTEAAAVKEGRQVDQSRSNKMALRLLGTLLGLIALFLVVDAVVIKGFFDAHV